MSAPGIFSAIIMPLNQLNFAQLSATSYGENLLEGIGLNATDAATYNTEAVNWITTVASKIGITLTAKQAQYMGKTS